LVKESQKSDNEKITLEAYETFSNKLQRIVTNADNTVERIRAACRTKLKDSIASITAKEKVL
jgi:hypothetical protein